MRLRHETWRVLEGHYKAGSVRAIGVSNFSRAHLEQLLAVAEVRPAINQVRSPLPCNVTRLRSRRRLTASALQIEVHPCYQQRSLRQYCQEQGMPPAEEP